MEHSVRMVWEVKMKRIMAMFLCLFLLLTAGCGQEGVQPPSPTTAASGDTSGSGTVTPPAPTALFRTGYPSGNNIVETPTRIVYFYNDQMCYYNKLDGESYIFCFDPLCDHQDTRKCLSFRFSQVGAGAQNFGYCAFNNRFYALRGQKLCSFSFDGSDLKVDYSFGENGGWDEYLYNTWGLYHLGVYDRYVYMITIDSETGERQLMRYDVAAGQMRNLSENKGNIMDYMFGYDTLYLMVQTEESTGMYRSDLELSMIEPASGMNSSSADGIFDGERFYYTEYRYDYDADTGSIETTPIYISIYDPQSGEISRIYEIEDGIVLMLLAVTEDAVYFTKLEPVYIGYIMTKYGKQETYNSTSRIYRMDKDGGNVTVILDDLHYGTFDLYVSGSLILIDGAYYIPGEGDVKSNGAFFIGKLDADGMITGLEMTKPIG